MFDNLPLPEGTENEPCDTCSKVDICPLPDLAKLSLLMQFEGDMQAIYDFLKQDAENDEANGDVIPGLVRHLLTWAETEMGDPMSEDISLVPVEFDPSKRLN
jgi:hypothetical protein